MKKLILILIIFIVSGCTTNYNLEINGSKFNENIDVIISKSEIPEDTSSQYGVESDDPITPFLNNNTSVFFSNSNIYYNKQVEEFDDYYNVKMSYEYDASDFKDSNSLNLCFDKFEFIEEENYYINAQGTFYCLYSDEMSINIKTKNKVIKNNADSVKGNTYTWNIDDSNKNNVDIEFEVSKNVSYINILVYILIIVLFMGVLLFINSIIRKNKESNEV